MKKRLWLEKQCATLAQIAQEQRMTLDLLIKTLVQYKVINKVTEGDGRRPEELIAWMAEINSPEYADLLRRGYIKELQEAIDRLTAMEIAGFQEEQQV